MLPSRFLKKGKKHSIKVKDPQCKRVLLSIADLVSAQELFLERRTKLREWYQVGKMG